MQRLLASLACVLAVVCGSGCGCSGGDAATSTGRPASASDQAQRRALERYLEAVAPVARDLARARAAAAAALDAFDATDPTTWSDAAAGVQSAGADLQQAARRLAAVPPPPALRGAQQRLEGSLDEVRRTADDAIDAAGDGDIGAVVEAAGTARPQLERLARQLDGFAAALGRRASELGVALPEALRELEGG